MKELEPTKSKEPEVQIVQDVKITPKFIGQVKKIKGLTMFEFDPVKMILLPAKYKETIVSIGKHGDNKVVHKLIVSQGCYYVQALNKHNAYKKLAKIHKNTHIHHGNNERNSGK